MAPNATRWHIRLFPTEASLQAQGFPVLFVPPLQMFRTPPSLPPARQPEYSNSGSVISYIPDDVSSVHSVAVTIDFPPMFRGFDMYNWLALPRRTAPSTIVPSEADVSSITGTSSVTSGRGVLLRSSENSAASGSPSGGMSTSLNASNRLKSYVERGRVGSRMGMEMDLSGGYKPGMEGNVYGGRSVGRVDVGLGRSGGLDDNVRSVSTAFESQAGMTSYD